MSMSAADRGAPDREGRSGHDYRRIEQESQAEQDRQTQQEGQAQQDRQTGQDRRTQHDRPNQRDRQARSARPVRRAGKRDRHGRGHRGPLAWPPAPVMASRRDRFDDIVRDVSEELDEYLEPRGLVVEYAAMDIPVDLGPTWSPEVPLARTIPATKSTPARIIAFRRPMEARSNSRGTLIQLVRAALSAELSTLFAIPIDELAGPEGLDDDY